MTLAVGMGGFVGKCCRTVADPEVGGRGGMHTRHRMCKRGGEHIIKERSGGRGSCPLLEGGLGGLPQEIFSNSHMKW